MAYQADCGPNPPPDDQAPVGHGQALEPAPIPRGLRAAGPAPPAARIGLITLICLSIQEEGRAFRIAIVRRSR